MAKGSDVFIIDGVDDEVAKGGNGGLIFHELVLSEGELAGRIDLVFGGDSAIGTEARVDGSDKGDVIGNFIVFFGGDNESEVSKVGLVGGDG